jgi:hypothetical protein
MSAGQKYQFELLSGRTIILTALDQHLTYGGLLAGHPSREMNRRIMDGLVRRHSGPMGRSIPVVLEPIETPVEKHSDPEWSTAANLPSITCVARFMSGVLPRDEEGIASMLSVIWFQDEFAFPIDPVVRVELAAIDWEAHAASYLP